MSEKKGLTGNAHVGIWRRFLWRRGVGSLKERLNKGRRSCERRNHKHKRIKAEITQEVNLLCTPSGKSDDRHSAFGGHAPSTDRGSMDVMIRQDPGLNSDCVFKSFLSLIRSQRGIGVSGPQLRDRKDQRRPLTLAATVNVPSYHVTCVRHTLSSFSWYLS